MKKIADPFTLSIHNVLLNTGDNLFDSSIISMCIKFFWTCILIKFLRFLNIFQQQEQDPTNLYIANLPILYTETHLENMFKDYGTVISTRILRKADNTSRGVGFCRMESTEKCDQIIKAFNGKLLPGKYRPTAG